MPLLSASADNLSVVLSGGLMTRSIPFSDRISIIKKHVRATWGTPACPEGVLYLIYCRNENGKVQPFYIGKASVIGKTPGKLSALFHPGYIRFAHNLKSNGHIGNMNEARLTPGHPYYPWIGSMFSVPHLPKIKTPIYVNMEVWDSKSLSCLPLLGHISVETEEALRIEIIRQAGCDASLLNKIGNSE